MAITNFVPEIWAARLLTSLKNALVYAAPGVVNRDYEGDITGQGDTVHITGIGDVTIGTYTGVDITFEDVDDDTRTLLIDQAKYFAFEIDDIEKAQARGDVMPEAAQNAAYGLRNVADTYVATAMATDVDAGNLIAEQTVTTATQAEQVIIDLKTRLDVDNVPDDGRWVVVTPAFEALLLRSTLFVPADASGSTDALRNGRIGRMFGFDVRKSNKAPNGPGAGAGKLIIAGHPMATSYADQIVKTEAVRLEKRFADGLKGLHVYGTKVVRPTCLAAADVIGA
jgi:hypothetical protein